MAHRVLIVDDHRDVMRMLRSALDTLEHDIEVVEAPSGEEAFLEVATGHIDLAVIDFFLPGMTGLELMDKIWRRNADTQIILISGTKDSKTRQKLVDSDAFAFFSKPISLTEFLDAVERSLGLERTVLPVEESAGGHEIVDNSHKSVPGLLSKYRQNMNAQAILLLSDQGLVQARAGALPDSGFETSLIISLMGIFSSANRISSYIHQDTPLSYHIFPGGDYDVLMVPVDKINAIVIVGERLDENNRNVDLTSALLMLKSEIEHILTAPQMEEEAAEEEIDEDFMDELEEMMALGVSGEFPDINFDEIDLPTEKEVAVEVEDNISSDELDALFKQQPKIHTDDLSSFWDAALDTDAAKQSDIAADKLTYEQAMQLGLAPGKKA